MSGWSTGPSWGVSGGAMLNSQAPDERIVDFHQTLRPFEQTMRLPRQPMPRSTRQSLDFSKELQHPDRRPRQSLQPPGKSSRPAHRTQQQPRRPKARQDRPSQPIPQQRSPPSGRSLRLSQLVTEQSRKSKPNAEPRPSLEVSLGLSRQNGNDKDVGNSPQVQIRLSSAQRREIMSRLNDSVRDVMTSMLPGDSNSLQWKAKLNKKNVAYYMDEVCVKPGQTRFCCVSHTHATVDEVMGLFIAPHKDALLRSNKLLFDNLIDVKVVAKLRRPTKERPMNSMYIRHSTFQTPGPLANREMCVAVATDMIRQPDGSTIGYCLWDSIDDEELLKAVSKPGFDVCKTFRSGFFLRHPGRRESTSGDSMQGQTKIVYMVGMELGAWTAGLTTRLHMEKHGSTLERLCSHFRRKYLDPRSFVMKTQWESKCSAKTCKQCDKLFQVLSNRVNCHACGHVVCRSCTTKESVELHSVGFVPIHVCFWCLEKAGLPAPSSTRKTRTSLRQRRHHSETASTFRQSIAVVYADVNEEDDTDTGEWAITTMGVPVRPSRMAAFV